MRAPAAGSSLDTVSILIGMTAIPVSIYSLTSEDERLTESHSPAGNPVGQKFYDKVTGEDLERDQRVPMRRTPNGPVYVDPSEVDLDLVPKTLTIEAFYPRQRESEFLISKHRTVEPAQTKTKKNGAYTKHDAPATQERLSALLMAMEQRKVVAFGKLVTRGREYPVLLTSEGRLSIVHYEQEVREARESKLAVPPAAMILDSLGMIDGLTSSEPPNTTDRLREATDAVAMAKSQGLALVPPIEGGDPDALMQALKDSVRKSTARRSERTG